jgi:hypothetical protein
LPLNLQSRIVVDHQKRLTITSYTVFIFLALFVFSPSPAHAGALSDFTDKVKAIFTKDSEEDIPSVGTTQTMALFKPTVVDAASISGEADENGKKFERGGTGLMAQIFQHETDHLDGILFIDKAKDLEDLPPEKNKIKKDEIMYIIKYFLKTTVLYSVENLKVGIFE